MEIYENFPGPHGRHSEALLCIEFPSGQTRQAKLARSEVYVPLGQAEHDTAPVILENIPAEQSLHLEVPIRKSR